MFVWNEAKKRSQEKVNWNRKKRKDTIPVEEGLFKGVFVGDLELESFEKEVIETSKNEIRDRAVVYGGIKINEKEEDILNLPPNHTTFPKVNIEEFDTEL